MRKARLIAAVIVSVLWHVGSNVKSFVYLMGNTLSKWNTLHLYADFQNTDEPYGIDLVDRLRGIKPTDPA